MKKIILLVLVLAMAFAVIGAAYLNLFRLTIVNKSGGELYVQIYPKYEDGLFYYLPIAEGSRANPTETVWTLVEAVYKYKVWFYENGVMQQCPNADLDENRVPTLSMTKNQKMTVLPCFGNKPKSMGEDGIFKFWRPEWKYIY